MHLDSSAGYGLVGGLVWLAMAERVVTEREVAMVAIKPTVPPAPETLIASIIQRVAELPDRTSPDDCPEVMLVTAAELSDILRDVLAVREAQIPPETPVQQLRGLLNRIEAEHDAPMCPTCDGKGWITPDDAEHGVQVSGELYGAGYEHGKQMQAEAQEAALHAVVQAMRTEAALFAPDSEYIWVCGDLLIEWADALEALLPPHPPDPKA